MGIHRQRGAHVSPSDEDTHTRAWAGRPRTGSPPNARPPYTIHLEVGSQYMNPGSGGHRHLVHGHRVAVLMTTGAGLRRAVQGPG